MLHDTRPRESNAAVAGAGQPGGVRRWASASGSAQAASARLRRRFARPGSASGTGRRPRMIRTTRATAQPMAMATEMSPRRPDRRRPSGRATSSRPPPGPSPTGRWRGRTADRHGARKADHQHQRQGRKDDERRGPLERLRGDRRERRGQRAPRSRAEIGGRPVRPAGLALARPGQHHRQLAGTEREQHRGRREVQPAADRRAQQARHVGAGEEPTDDRQTELQPAERRVDPALRGRPVRVGMDDEIAEPPADDRSGHDADRDEDDVVRAEAAGLARGSRPAAGPPR